MVDEIKKELKRGRGRPSFQPTDETRELVLMMSINGVDHTSQAKALRLDPKSLRRHFREQLDCGKMLANAKVAGSLFKKATDGNVPAQIFWLKVQAKWKEVDRIEVTGNDGVAFMNPLEWQQRVTWMYMEMKKKLPSLEEKNTPASD